jgi:PTS system mannose-specific IIB component
MFSLFRIDDRLVHGQTMIKLLPNYPCDGIIIINDEIAENAQMKSIYQSVLPGNVKLYVFNFENAVKKLCESPSDNPRHFPNL